MGAEAAGGNAAQGDDLARLLGSLLGVHRSTHSLLEQHGLWGKLEKQVLTIAIKSTMQKFFEKADRKAYLDKAAALAFGPGIQTVLAFEQGDTARPKQAGAAEAPAVLPAETPGSSPAESVTRVVPASAPVPAAEASPAQTHVETAPQPVAPVIPPAAPAAVAPPVRPPQAPAAPIPHVPSPEGHQDILARAADIFNGRVTEPTA